MTPWKVAASSPCAQWTKVFTERLLNTLTINFCTPRSALHSESEIEQYLLKETEKFVQEGYAVLALDEAGKQYSSDAFSELLEKREIQNPKGIAFIFGGAYGLPRALAGIQKLDLFSLSSLTLAHEVALLVLVEQLYRSRMIRIRHPYHHGEISALARERKK